VNYAELSTAELVAACAQSGHAGAWEEFVRRFHRLIAGTALSTARRWGQSSPQIVDELVQETYLKLCSDPDRLLRSFELHPAEAFPGYLRVVTANLVHDHFKSAASRKRGGRVEMVRTDDSNAETLADPSSRLSDGGVSRRILMREVDDCLRSLLQGDHAGRDRRIFWLYYRIGLSAQAISTLPTVGLTTKGVESTILRLTREVRQRLVAGAPSAPQEPKQVEGIDQA
jgi:RNA polymerase sigma-70 factor (ECF subfamily)